MVEINAATDDRNHGDRRSGGSRSCAPGRTTAPPADAAHRGRQSPTPSSKASRSASGCRRSARPPAPSARRRSATRRRSAATSPRARRPATGCRCCPRSTPSVHLVVAAGARSLPFAEFMVGLKRTALRPGELIDGGHGPVLRRLAGLRQGRRAQRDGHRHAGAAWPSTTAGGVRLALGSVGPTIVRCADAEAFAVGRRRHADRSRSPTPTSLEFGALAAAASRPIDDHRSTAGVPAPRGRGAGRAACCEGRSRMADERALRAARQRRAARGRRRVARREPAVRAARAARPARREGRVRAGRVRVVQRAGRRRAGVLVPRAGGVGRRPGDRHRRGPRRRRRADRRAAGVRRRRRGAVRVLHARPDRRRARPARAQRRSRPSTEIREELSGNICRCTGLRPDLAAVQRVASSRRGAIDEHRRRRRAIAGDRHGRIGDEPDPARRHRQGAGRVRVLVRPLRPTACCGAPRCARRTRTPAIVPIDVSPAWRIAGVEAVVTAEDVPGQPTYGLISQDQPVFATDVVRYVGEPVAAVAADHPETCRRALAAIVVEYEVLDPLARSRGGDRRQPPADPPRRQRASATSASCAATRRSSATSWSRAPTRSACRTRRSSASRRRWPCPTPAAHGVELYIATQWLHEDRKQIAACLGLARRDGAARRSAASAARSAPARTSACRSTPACWRCAPGGRCRCAYSREESFLGHVHRHPATIWMRHHATADGAIVQDRGARFVLDGGAYASTSSAVLVNAITHTQGPYTLRQRRRRRLRRAHQQPAVRGDARLRRRAGVLRPRGPDGPAGRGVRPRPGRDPAAQRDARPATG